MKVNTSRGCAFVPLIPECTSSISEELEGSGGWVPILCVCVGGYVQGEQAE